MPGAIDEDTSHSWYAATGQPQHPAEGSTLPVAEKEGAYSWCKAPRLGGQVVETGALARQMVAGTRWRATWSPATAAASPPASSRACWNSRWCCRPWKRWLDRTGARRTLVHHGAAGRRNHGSRPHRSRARLAGPLADGAPRPHPQLPDHRPDHLEFLTARRGRPARRAGTGAGRPAGRCQRAACRRRSTTWCAVSIRAWSARCIEPLNAAGLDFLAQAGQRLQQFVARVPAELQLSRRAASLSSRASRSISRPASCTRVRLSTCGKLE
jgi:hypothetical protein